MRGAWQTLRDRLAALDAQISVLEAERKIIRKELRTISYPVLKLPPEITSGIFVHCLPTLPSDPRLLEAPLLLLGICKGWREIALQTPALWASFKIDDGYDSTLTLDFRKEILAFSGDMGRQRFSHWLRRAGSAPLDVNITYYGRIPRSQPAAPMRDMFIELFERAPQWRDVELASSVQDLAQKWVASALAGKLDTLERLRLQVLDRDDGNGLITVFSQAPNLREVSLGYLPLGRIALPWAQLTSLTVAEVSVRACVQVLQLTPRLTSFQLDGIMGELDNLALLAPLPNLKSFLLDYDDPNHTEDSVHIFRVLTIPNLTTLKLYQYGEGHQYVIDFLSRSSPAGLHKLLLRGPCDFLSDALPLMPTLADIEIEKLHAFQATAFLKTLHDSAAATHLQSITIHITTGHPASVDSLDYHVLVDTLTALKAHGLRSFRLTWHTNVDDIGLRPGWGVVERLSELVEDGGMHIYVGTTKQSWM